MCITQFVREEKMTKVVLWEAWYDSAEISLNKFKIQTPEESGVWKDLIGTTNIEEADYCIIFQQDSPNSRKISKEKKIFIQREPHAALTQSRFDLNEGLFKASYLNSFHFTTWWVEKTYSFLKELECPEKTKSVNTILSYKQKTYGHKLRHAFVTRMLQKYPGDIDVYGSFNLPSDHEDVIHNRYPSLDKYESSIDYHYQFVCENSQQENYFSEKIVDAFLCYNVPIYWGCPNIEDYFPEESFHTVDIGNHDAMDEIIEISKTPPDKTTMEAVAYARELILEKYNLWQALSDLIKSI